MNQNIQNNKHTENNNSTENNDSTENEDLTENNQTTENEDLTENNDSTENNQTTENEDSTYNDENCEIIRSNSFSSESLMTTGDDLTQSVDTINEEDNDYRYTSDDDENIEICVKEFIKLIGMYPEIVVKINKIKGDIKLLPDFMKFLKEKNNKLTLNILDNPSLCFEKIFNSINNNYMNEHIELIKQIQNILPHIDKYKIYEALQVSNNNLDLAINYLYSDI